MNKISVLFVCLGNICRSPAAEAIFISLLEKKGLTDGFIVDSAGTGSWHIGKKADSRMRIAAERRDINILSRARQITNKDFDEFNYILAMDDSNFRNIHDLKNRTASSGFASIKKSLFSSFGNFDQITPGEKNLATSADIFSANGSDE